MDAAAEIYNRRLQKLDQDNGLIGVHQVDILAFAMAYREIAGYAKLHRDAARSRVVKNRVALSGEALKKELKTYEEGIKNAREELKELCDANSYSPSWGEFDPSPTAARAATPLEGTTTPQASTAQPAEPQPGLKKPNRRPYKLQQSKVQNNKTTRQIRPRFTNDREEIVSLQRCGREGNVRCHIRLSDGICQLKPSTLCGDVVMISSVEAAGVKYQGSEFEDFLKRKKELALLPHRVIDAAAAGQKGARRLPAISQGFWYEENGVTKTVYLSRSQLGRLSGPPSADKLISRSMSGGTCETVAEALHYTNPSNMYPVYDE
jgi:hypothetical protein